MPVGAPARNAEMGSFKSPVRCGAGAEGLSEPPSSLASHRSHRVPGKLLIRSRHEFMNCRTARAQHYRAELEFGKPLSRKEGADMFT